MRRIAQAARAFWSDGDHWLLLLCLTSNLFGLVLIYSATRYSVSLHGYFAKQLWAMLLGLVFYVVLTFLDVEALTRRFRLPLFISSLCLLLLLVPFGNDDATGNKNWISIPGTNFNLQPAELVKLSFILLLAYQFQKLQEKGVSRPSSVLQTAGHAFLMCALLFLVSRDMGMLLVYLFIFLVMAWAAGVHLGWFLGGAAAAGVGGYFLWPHLPAYVQMRFLVVFDHNLDPQGKGFQQLRSLLAIGSGQTVGQGYLQGTQTQNLASSALPARHTDFIFSVAGEEFGLLGALAILLLLCAIILRCLWLSNRSQSLLCRYTAVGCAAMLTIQTVLNVGMCLFVVPVVGLTLPFFSAGGSSLITMYLAMGMLSGMKRRTVPAWRRTAMLYTK